MAIGSFRKYCYSSLREKIWSKKFNIISKKAGEKIMILSDVKKG